MPFSHPARLISAPWVLPIARPALAEAAVAVDGAGTAAVGDVGNTLLAVRAGSA